MRWKDMISKHQPLKSQLYGASGTCEVVEEVEGEGEAGGLRVEHGRLRTT